MDTSLKSLKKAFKNQAFSARYDREPGIYAFILVTPSDHSAFEDLVGAYEEIRWVTGKHIRVIGPSITVDNARVPRERVAPALKTRFDRECFEEFTVSN